MPDANIAVNLFADHFAKYGISYVIIFGLFGAASIFSKQKMKIPGLICGIAGLAYLLYIFIPSI